MPINPSPGRDQRNRENGWTTLPNEGPTEPAPPLVGAFDDRARELWAHWWSTPMARMWGRFDSPVLENLLMLTARLWADPIEDGDGKVLNPVSGIEHSERRQLEDRFGLSPAARRKLFWRVAGVDAPSVEAGDHLPEPGVDVPAAGGSNDPRRGLKVVG